MNNALGSSVDVNALGSGISISNVRGADAAAFVAASLVVLFCLFVPTTKTYADIILAPKPWLSASHAGVTVNDTFVTPLVTVNGADLNSINGDWDVTILKPANSQPSGTQGFYGIFRGTYGNLEGGDAVSGGNYSVVDAPAPIKQVTTNHVTFNLPAFGNASTPSDTYTIVAGYFPTTIGIYDPITDTGIDRPTTDADIAHWFADPYDPNMNFPITWISQISFNYVAGAATASCSKNCESNVLFIPGVESSRLYTLTGSTEHQLWEPGFLSNQADVKSLYLDSSGASINHIYTKTNAAIDTEGAPIIAGYTYYADNIYKSFLAQLAGLKVSSSISDYLVFPYDWRMSPDDVVNKGTQYDDGTHYLDQELILLAKTSKTGKVTIVAHSNGGLITKALMIKLQSEGQSNLVDKIIFVDVPQTGTPKAIASMLHGDFQDIPESKGFMASLSTARGLAENMPDAYDLLPSAAYFTKVATPVVDLSNAPTLKSTAGISTPTITNSTQLASFITGAGGRKKPVFLDTETPDVLSSKLLTSAATLHANLDSWVPPVGVQVIQIAGWGIDTPSEVTYSEVAHAQCQNGSCETVVDPRHIVNMTEDGDGTVVIPSQVATTAWQTYYINVNKINNDKHTNFNHANITETQIFEDLFSQLIASSSPQLSSLYVTSVEPTPTSLTKSLRLRVLSPVSLDVYDAQGNHTGLAPNPNPQSDDLYVEEQIPGSYYQRYGEGQYIGLPANGVYNVKLHGTDTGTFTFEVTPVSGGVATIPVTFSGIPVTASSTVAISLNSTNPTATSLVVDENGDGKTDMTISSSAQLTDPAAYAKLMFTDILGMDLGLLVKIQLEAKIMNASYLIGKSTQWNNDDGDLKDTNTKDVVKTRVLRKLNLIETYVENEVTKSKPKLLMKVEQITPAQGTQILGMIEELKVLVGTKL